jgi:hypothetical protein
MPQPGVFKFDKFRRQIVHSGTQLIFQSKCRLCGETRTTTQQPGLEWWEHEHRCTPEKRRTRRAS